MLAFGIVGTVALSRLRAGTGLGVEFVAWCILATALLAAAAAAAHSGIERARRIDLVAKVRWRRLTVWTMTALAVVAGTAIVYTALEPHPTEMTWRGVALTIAATAGGAPVIRAYLGVAAASRAIDREGTLGAQVTAHLRLRDEAHDLLRPLGALVTLATFALAAARLDSTRPHPALEVLGFGVLGTALVGFGYAVARTALRRDAARLRDLLAPVAGADGATVRAELAARADVDRLLGLTTSMIGELQTGVWIAGPLLVAATGMLVAT